ncbi:MAG: N-acetylglucosamine-6-phosphate deacetylase [Firmicutes bacterium]|nr:N-acetylglucosamine-6-phosphate deacetylase [Bacillota bacterium]
MTDDMIISGKRILIGGKIQSGYIKTENGKITEVGREYCKKGRDMGDLLVLPGFVDIHVHGGNGYDVMDKKIEKIAEYKIGEGVLLFSPTLITADIEEMKRVLVSLRNYDGKYAKITGAFMEGPYISEKYKGAHDEKYIRKIDIDELKNIYEEYGDIISRIIFAPEKENALDAVRVTGKMGIGVGIGHSGADHDTAVNAIKNGAMCGIHIYNAMSGFGHRDGGMVGALLNNDDVYCEIICDMVHTSRNAVEIMLRCKNSDKIILITDCMRAGGMKDGEYMLGSVKTTVKDGIARTESGNLAGSTLKMNIAVKNMAQICKSIEKAVEMATINPCRLIGADDERGSIERGKFADIIAVDDYFNVKFVMSEGKIMLEQT